MHLQPIKLRSVTNDLLLQSHLSPPLPKFEDKHTKEATKTQGN